MGFMHYRTRASGVDGISFPGLECWNGTTKVATIAADVNKQRVLCRISQKTLVEKYGVDGKESMQSVAQHRAAIQEAARALIEDNVYEEDGSILIRAHDLTYEER
jgi:hypothetical protein